MVKFEKTEKPNDLKKIEKTQGLHEKNPYLKVGSEILDLGRKPKEWQH